MSSSRDGRGDVSALRELLVSGEAVGWVVPPLREAAAQLHATVIADLDGSHLSESDGSCIVSDPEECLAQEERLEQRVATFMRLEGITSDRALKQMFKLIDCLIGQYKLNRTDALLTEIEAVCTERGGDWHVKHVQAKAFVRWKQYRFKEALALFLEQQEVVGGSAALCENIGHTYSSLGDLPKAEEYFERAIELLKRGSFGNRGGIYMGLGLVRDRLGKTREALPILQQALEHYKTEHTRNHVQLDSSIIAKAHMSLGKVHEKLGDPAEAAEHITAALGIFRRTVGEDSPLTANAMGALGKLKAELGDQKHGLALLKSALKLEVAKDAFHLETVWELFSRVKDLHMDDAKRRQQGEPHADHLAALHQTYSQYLPLISAMRLRIRPEHEHDELGTLAVLYKTVGEIHLLAQDYHGGREVLQEAVRYFKLVKDFDCQSLVEGCEMLLSIADANLPKQLEGA